MPAGQPAFARPPGLQVIGAGFGRTGTTSLKRALELLDCGPCYHMQTAMTRPGHCRFWLQARQHSTADFGRVLHGFRSAIDWPVCEFYEELLVRNPAAKVVLTTRPLEHWYDSVRETLWGSISLCHGGRHRRSGACTTP